MKTFWCTETNRLVMASPCDECDGFQWRYLGPESFGLWVFAGCVPYEPSEESFILIQKKEQMAHKGEHSV